MSHCGGADHIFFLPQWTDTSVAQLKLHYQIHLVPLEAAGEQVFMEKNKNY